MQGHKRPDVLSYERHEYLQPTIDRPIGDQAEMDVSEPESEGEGESLDGSQHSDSDDQTEKIKSALR